MEVIKTPTKGKAKATKKTKPAVKKPAVKKTTNKAVKKTLEKKVKAPNYNRLTKPKLIELVVAGEKTTADLAKATEKIKTLNKRIRTKNAEIRELKSTNVVDPKQTAEYKELESNSYESMLEMTSKIEAATIALTDLNNEYAKKSNEVELYKEQLNTFTEKVTIIQEGVEKSQEAFRNRENQLLEELEEEKGKSAQLELLVQEKVELVNDSKSYVESMESEFEAKITEAENISTRLEDITEQLQEKEKANAELIEKINQLENPAEVDASTLPKKTLVQFVQDWLMYMKWTKGSKVKTGWFVAFILVMSVVLALASVGIGSLAGSQTATQIASGISAILTVITGNYISKEKK